MSQVNVTTNTSGMSGVINAKPDENLNADENNATIKPDDNETTRDEGAGAAKAPEDTPSANEVIIESQRQQIEALTAHIESLNNQISHIIRTGGMIGTPQPNMVPDTGSGTNNEPPAPDFAAIAKGFIN